MAKIELSWTDAEKRVLDLIKEKEESFLQYCTENWEVGLFLTGSSTVGWQWQNRIANSPKPRKGDEVLVVGRAISIKVEHDSKWALGKAIIGSDYRKQLEFIEKVRILYRSKIKEKLTPVKKGVRNYTSILRELVERGFVVPYDLQADDGDYVIETTFGPLVYKDAFSSRISVKKAFRRFAIDTYCTIKQI